MSAENTIAFQGEFGAYSHLACQQVFPDMTPLPTPSFDEAFAAVERASASLAMIPIENSLGGRVADIHHLLPEAELHIVAEHYQPVHHCLLALPGTTLSDIKRVESHPQALAQCRRYIRDIGVQPVAAADTAGAAREVAERGDRSVAAIASSLAGETYGLSTLQANIEDRAGNTTRFVVMSSTPERPVVGTVACMTSLVFQVRSVPAALYKGLGGFATNGVNITKLESYIEDEQFRVAQFYIEIEGHPDETSVALALDELSYFSTELKILGVYPAHPKRS
ncbi:MAG: prephenate dehydratase [Pseudomonadota bacterium]